MEKTVSSSFIYTIVKDFINYFSYSIEEKIIDDPFLENLKHTDNFPKKIRWTKESKIESRKLNGWRIFYHIDKVNKKKFILKNQSGDVLMSKDT